MHTNNVSFNRVLNQLVIDVNMFGEVIVIDHSTTTAEAKGRTGGRYGKGGDILYRWGNPANYGATGTKYLSGQHCGSWIPDTMPGTNLPIPGGGNMIAISNRDKKIVEWTPPGTKNGVYPRTAGAAFEPASPVWTFTVSDMQTNEGSVQRLPNGNTFICTGGAGGGMGGTSSTGRAFELNSSGATVWDLTGFPQSTEGTRYAYGYLGAKTPVVIASPVYSTQRLARISADPLSGQVRIRYDNQGYDAQLSLFSLCGRELYRSPVGSIANGWNLGSRPGGDYLVKITSGGTVVWDRVLIPR
jgi:hypothetical protein